MSKHSLIYTADEFKEHIDSVPLAGADLVKTAPTATASDGQSAILTELSDKDNLVNLLDKPFINCILPVRLESVQTDVVNNVNVFSRVLASSTDSVILANHDEKTMIANYSLLQSEERWQVIRDLGEFVLTTGSFDGFDDICKTVASELLTNAFYNAPRDEQGRPLQPNRREIVSLQTPVTASFGQDEKYVWMKVTDPFGTFSRETLLNNLLKSASVEELNVSFGEGGAGIGLYMVFRWCSQMLFQFHAKKETTVLVKLLKTRRHKIFESQRAIFEVTNS